MFIQYWSICSVSLLMVFVMLLWIYTRRTFNYWKKIGVPFVQPSFFFGNVLDVILMKASIGDLCRKLYSESQAPYLGMYVLSQPFLLIRDLVLIKNVLVRDSNHFMDRTIADNRKVDPIGSSFLLLMKQPHWGLIRKKTNPFFSPKSIKLIHGSVIDSATKWTKYLDKVMEVDKFVEIRELVAKFAVDSILSSGFGLNSECYDNEDAPFRATTRSIFNWQKMYSVLRVSCYHIAPGMVKLFGIGFLDKNTSKFMSAVFSEEMNKRKDSNLKRNDFIDVLVEQMEEQDGYQLTQQELIGQAAQFFIAGYDTSTSTLSFALYELAKRPDIQRQLREELLRIKETYGEFTYQSLGDMTYLDMVVKETLRMYPVFPFLDRRCTADYKLPGNEIVIEKGVGVYIPVYGIHNDPQYYPEPEVFDPLRFSSENVKNRPSFSYLPFGDGPRFCVGKRYGEVTIKTGLSHILSQYEVKICEKTQRKMELEPAGFLLQPRNGSIYLEFVKL